MLLTATLCLLALGAVMVFSASSTTRILQDGGLSDSAFYLKRTLMFGAVGLVIMHLTARHGLSAVRNLTPAILGGSLLPARSPCSALGTSVNGASRWIGSGFLQIQPSEIAKVALVLYGADLLARKPKRARSIEGFMPFLLVVGAACAADHAGARHGDDDGHHLRRRRHPDRRRRPPPRPRPDRPRRSASSPC